jgi:hypothetical protein
MRLTMAADLAGTCEVDRFKWLLRASRIHPCGAWTVLAMLAEEEEEKEGAMRRKVDHVPEPSDPHIAE